MGQLNQAADSFERLDTKLVLISPDTKEKTLEFWEAIGEKPKITILLDPEFKLVKRLKLYKENNMNGESIPAVFVIDKSGILRFKYIAQFYSDRPPIEHLKEMISVIRK